MIDGNRGTGRTNLMLQAVLKAAESPDTKIVVMAHSTRFASGLRLKLARMAIDAGVASSSVSADGLMCVIDFANGSKVKILSEEYSQNFTEMDADSIVFRDHYAMERSLSNACNKMNSFASEMEEIARRARSMANRGYG